MYFSGFYSVWLWRESDLLGFVGRDVQKATYNFTTAIGQGAFGPVYKAQMSTGETFAVKVLAANSTQGQNEFLAEVIGSLHLHTIH